MQLVTSFIENPSAEDTSVKGEEDECVYSHPPFVYCLSFLLSVPGSLILFLFIVWVFCCCFLSLCLFNLRRSSLAASLMCEPVPETAFADYVQRHHKEDNQLVSDEYAVSL